MIEYPITDHMLTQSDCYTSKKKTSATGIQVHSVGSKGTTTERWEKSWNRPNRDVCANYTIDVNGIYRLLPDWKRCWLSGSWLNGNANDDYLGFEICEPSRKKDTPEVAADLYRKTVFLCVYLCRTFGILPENIRAHYELRAMKIASNHSDVRHWWGKKGTAWENYTMETLREDVAKELGVPYRRIPSTIQRGARGADVILLQAALNSVGYTLLPDGKFGKLTQIALLDFQSKNALSADGLCGPKTWKALEKAGAV